MPTFQDKFIEVEGYKTRYWSFGDSSSVILLLHGFAFSVELWESNIEGLAKNHRVIALDLLGFGLTDKPKKKQSLEVFPLFVSSFMKKIGVLKANVIGHSMGGLIAIKLAQMRPESVESLVLIGSAGFKVNIPLHFRIFSLPFFGEMMIKPNKKGLASALRYNTFHKSVITKRLVERLYEFSLHPEMGKTLLRISRSAISVWGFKRFIVKNVREEIDKITMPVLIIWGRQDSIIHLSHGYAAHNLIKHSKFVIFEECGHLPYLEYPEKFNSTILGFLGK